MKAGAEPPLGRVRAYLLTVKVAGKKKKVAGKKKDGSKKHRKNRGEEGIGFRRTCYLRKK